VYQAGADAWPVNATLSLDLKSTIFPWYRPALHPVTTFDASLHHIPLLNPKP